MDHGGGEYWVFLLVSPILPVLSSSASADEMDTRKYQADSNLEVPEGNDSVKRIRYQMSETHVH